MQILKKHRVGTEAVKTVGASPCKHIKTMNCSLSSRVRKSVATFFVRDDVSRVLQGKKCAITRNKIKQQKRVYIVETLNNVSFTTFWRLKAFLGDLSKRVSACTVNTKHVRIKSCQSESRTHPSQHHGLSGRQFKKKEH